jgi:uncharacterized protein
MINSHTNESITLNHVRYTDNLIVTNQNIHCLKEKHTSLHEIGFKQLSNFLHGDLLIIGQNDLSILHLASLQATLLKEKGMGMGMEIMNIGSACRTFNILLSESRQASLLILF